MNHQAIEKAFTKATLAATQILRFAVEHPPDLVEVDGKLVKTADPAVQAKGVAYLAGALAREVARVALGPTYAEHQAMKAEWLVKFEARQTEIAKSHVECNPTPCELCVIAKDEQEMYDRIVDKAMSADDRPVLDHDRAEMTPDIPTTPWPSRRRAEQHVAQANPPAVVSSDVSKALAEEGFEFAETDDQGLAHYLHRDAGHEVIVHESGQWALKSGWNHVVIAGDGPAGLQQALEEEEN